MSHVSYLLGRVLLWTLFIPLIFSSCSSNDSIPCSKTSLIRKKHVRISLNEKNNNLEKFFRYFLFLEGGVYTLLGSKPMTIFSICYEEEGNTNDQYAHHRSFIINKENKEDLDFYYSLNSDQKKRSILVNDCDYIFDVASLWDEWEKFSENLNISKKYLFFKRELTDQEKKSSFSSCKKAYDIIFINILQTACVLEKHYDQFKKAFGCDFNPLEELLKISHTKTPFWDCFFGENSSQHPYLIGLLYGYGWENALIFKWKYQNEIFSKNVRDFLNQIEARSSGDSLLHIDVLRNSAPFSCTNFPLPNFASFQINDPNIKKYSQEREEIMEYYKGKDFVQATLNVLISNQAK